MVVAILRWNLVDDDEKDYFFLEEDEERSQVRGRRSGDEATFIKCKYAIETLNEALVIKYKFLYI